MAKVDPALQTIASLSDEALQAFDKVIQARQAEFDQKIAAYKNTTGHSDYGPPLARLLKDASYVPAADDRLLTDRSGKKPDYVILARVADASASPEEGKLVAALTRGISDTAAQKRAPHLVVGLAGEIVQLADLERATVFLEKTYSPPGQIPYANREQEISDTIIGFTAATESSSKAYAAWNPNDGGKGVSWGFIQFNQRVGTLPQLLREMHRVDPARFEAIFGELAPSLLNSSWVRSSDTDLSLYEDLFITAAGYPLFQAAQRTLAKTIYWADTLRYAQKFKIRSQRGHAILFDTLVQKTPSFLDKVAAQVVPLGSEYARLQELATLADTLKNDAQTPYTKPYQRRRNLLLHTALSDVALELSEPPAKTTSKVEDPTVIVIQLEGRAGDPMTMKQRDAVAKCLRVINLSYGIPLSTDRVLGLDRLTIASESSNPGQAFGYVDVLSAARGMTDLPAIAWFKQPQPVNSEVVSAGAKSLRVALSQNRSIQGLKRLAILQGYGGLKGIEQANTYASVGRAQHAAAATLQAKTSKSIEAKGAANTAQLENVKPVPRIDDDTVRGLLYDFETGMWNDGKPVGRYGDV